MAANSAWEAAKSSICKFEPFCQWQAGFAEGVMGRSLDEQPAAAARPRLCPIKPHSFEVNSLILAEIQQMN